MQAEAESARDGATPPIVCYVTDRKALSGADPLAALISSIQSAITAEADWVQIREKDLTPRDSLYVAATAVREAEKRGARSSPTRVIVNDRLDVALAAGAAGVHLGRESVPAATVTRWLRGGNAPPDFLVGVSCHSLMDAREAEAAGVSYLIFGPVFDTPSKRTFGAPQGIAKLTEVCAAVRIPVIAIGGVDEQNAAECVRAGASGVAAIRLFQEQSSANSLAERVAKLHALRVRVDVTR